MKSPFEASVTMDYSGLGGRQTGRQARPKRCLGANGMMGVWRLSCKSEDERFRIPGLAPKAYLWDMYGICKGYAWSVLHGQCMNTFGICMASARNIDNIGTGYAWDMQ